MRGVASTEDADFDARVAAMKTWPPGVEIRGLGFRV